MITASQGGYFILLAVLFGCGSTCALSNRLYKVIQAVRSVDRLDGGLRVSLENGMSMERESPSAGWFNCIQRIRVQDSLTCTMLYCQVTAKYLKPSSPSMCRDRSFPSSLVKKARHRIERNENVDSHLRFEFPVQIKAHESVGAVLFLFLEDSLIKVSMVSRLQRQRDCLL